MSPQPQSWALVVPVKRLDVAKSRLAVDPALRTELALAMALDTVAACLACGAAVVVVTDDERAAASVRDLGAQVVPDVPDAGLNAALRHGAQVADGQRPGTAVAAVSSDLPALTAAALTAALAHAQQVPVGVVADAGGTGTTLFTASDVSRFVPAYGDESWQRHLTAGAADLTGHADPRLRRDVDTVADLAAAVALGCGRATSGLVAAHRGLLEPRRRSS